MLTLFLILPLRWLNPVTTAFILRDEHIDSVWIYQSWTPLEAIAPVSQMAVLAAEDQRFPKHYGLDFTELTKVLSHSGVPRRGASTITQQLVKNLYLWPNKGVVRKAVEAYMAMCMEVLLPKSRILELYLNVIEFGQGIYGITDASEHYFDKLPQQLNRIDASILAAVLPNPKKMKVEAPSPYVYERWIYGLLFVIWVV